MYQSYPSGGQMPEEPQRPATPQPVVMAARLMYVGAVLSGIELVVGLATIGSLKSAIRKADPTFTASQLHTAEVAAAVSSVFIGLLAIGLWVWMAWANGAGKNWARIVASVLFGLNTLFLLLSLIRPHASVGLAFGVIVWLTGLGAVVLLWRAESSGFFSAVSGKGPQPS